MKREKLFRNKWNTKTLLILATCLAVFGVLSLISYKIYKGVTRNRQVQNVVNVETTTRVESEWEFGSFERVSGTDYAMAPTHSKQNYQTSYYEKDASAVRNYLFVNTVDKSSRWLIPTNKYLFLTTERLPRQQIEQNTRSMKQADDNKDEAVKWIKYEIVKSDTNLDGRFTAKDRRTIAVSSATGEGYVEVIDDVEDVLGSMLRDNDTLLIFYRTNGNSFVTEVNLPSRQVTITRELPKIQPE
ncbi:MAG: hypothetical protein M3209_05955 [Acidobacteriota bacterium]|nr:hypothetical protein [Acidobacteriota bacterium]